MAQDATRRLDVDDVGGSYTVKRLLDKVGFVARAPKCHGWAFISICELLLRNNVEWIHPGNHQGADPDKSRWADGGSEDVARQVPDGGLGAFLKAFGRSLHVVDHPAIAAEHFEPLRQYQGKWVAFSVEGSRIVVGPMNIASVCHLSALVVGRRSTESGIIQSSLHERI